MEESVIPVSPRAGPEMRCLCGEIAFVQQIALNPCPENPTPCYSCYKIIIQKRNEKILEGILENEN